MAPGLERRLVRLGWFVAVTPVLAVLLAENPDQMCDDCPDNKLLVRDSPQVLDVLTVVAGVMIIVLLAGVALVLIRRWRVFGPVQRRALAPVLWTGAATAAVGVAAIVADVAGRLAGAHGSRPARADRGGAVRLPAGLLRSRLSRAGAVSALVERFGGTSVRDALAEALGDPGLSLAYWLPDPGRYVDAEGRPFALPGDGDERAATEIERGGAKLAAIVHDRALCEEPELVRAAGGRGALALENDRLDAELRARYAELQASRARLVAAGDAARRRIERDLHDGAQQRFVALALTLRLARSRRCPTTPRPPRCSTAG